MVADPSSFHKLKSILQFVDRQPAPSLLPSLRSQLSFPTTGLTIVSELLIRVADMSATVAGHSSNGGPVT